MLSSTRTSQENSRMHSLDEAWRASFAASAAECGGGAVVGMRVVLDGLDLDHGQEQPGDGDIDCQARELVAGTGAERAGPAGAAEGADEAAAFTALNQDQQNNEGAE